MNEHIVTIDVDAHTDDQEAMLRFLGNPPEVQAPTVVSYWGDPPAGRLALPTSPPGGIVRRYRCPVVEVLGRPRAVLPNGDLSTVNETAGRQ